MSPTQEPRSAKRHERIISAKLAIKQAERYITSYPAASATEIVRNLKLALGGLLSEVE